MTAERPNFGNVNAMLYSTEQYSVLYKNIIIRDVNVTLVRQVHRESVGQLDDAGRLRQLSRLSSDGSTASGCSSHLDWRQGNLPRLAAVK